MDGTQDTGRRGRKGKHKRKRDGTRLPASVHLGELLVLQLAEELREAERMLDLAVRMPVGSGHYSRACAAKASIKAEQLALAKRIADLGGTWYARSLSGPGSFLRWTDDMLERGKMDDRK